MWVKNSLDTVNKIQLSIIKKSFTGVAVSKFLFAYENSLDTVKIQLSIIKIFYRGGCKQIFVRLRF